VLSGRDLKQRIVHLARAATVEITPADEDLVEALAGKLPAGTLVYVAHTPRVTLQDVVRVAAKVEASGLRASPHIVARRVATARSLRDAAAELADGGIERALVIAGDSSEVAGIYADTIALLESGILTDAGIRRIGVAGHPEGHPHIGPGTLWQALQAKQAYAARTGIRMHIVTQFGFDPAALCAWDRHLPEHGITLPVYVGMAGPAPLSKLIMYAMQCGVGASLRGILRNMPAMRNVAGLAASPDEMLASLASSCAESPRIVGPHFYSFGGAMATARWLRAVADGSFELLPEGGRFHMEG
jgi:methylenetetrahydrofolate reductase (NADPH)